MAGEHCCYILSACCRRVSPANVANFDFSSFFSFIMGSGQEVVIQGQDKVFKDVIEPLENVSVTMIPTGKQDIKEFGSPEEVRLISM